MKRIVAMQDLSCFGKCSLTVIAPVVSAMGVACTVLPTAVLSTHTAYPGPAVTDLTGQAAKTLDHWAGLGIGFDGILTGYLADGLQAKLAERLIDGFSGPDTVVVCDPAMGDHGTLYSGLTDDLVDAMGRLCARADLILPNVTEAALLTGMEFRENADEGYCRELSRELKKLGSGSVMITGFRPTPDKVGFFWSDGNENVACASEALPRACHGTGDLFAGVTMGSLMRRMKPAEAGALAAEFVKRVIAATPADSRQGTAFEGELGWLMAQINL